MKLLAIEDDIAWTRLLGVALARHNWDVVQAPCLADGLCALRGGAFDAVLVDLTLPDSSSEKTLARLPEIAQLARPARIVVATGALPATAVPDGVVKRAFEKGEEGILDNLIEAITRTKS